MSKLPLIIALLVLFSLTIFAIPQTVLAMPSAQSITSTTNLTSTSEINEPPNTEANEWPIWGMLRDPIWQFVGVPLAIITIFVGGWISYRIFHLQTYKSISYAVLIQPLVTVLSPKVKGRIEFLVDGKPVLSPKVALLRISNTGNTDIKEDDFSHPLTVDIDGKIINVSQSISSPDGLANYIKFEIVDDTQIKFDKHLLNKGEWFEVQLLIDSASNKKSIVKIDGRIAGISDIKSIDYAKVSQNNSASFWPAIIILCLALLLSLYLSFVIPQLAFFQRFIMIMNTSQPFRLGFLWGILLGILFLIVQGLLIRIYEYYLKIQSFLIDRRNI